ncbi:hypothetical protein Pth03_51440 [Planotetraspora thailandica]|uniref:Uncharacterized protein n=1 Tax=Planotetraspora thailandica TaxID=487172 RepID=A0A8J3V667_9ACTN|nr:hypothetical protein Pth03_51440 [Planotetraspora thailandica]
MHAGQGLTGRGGRHLDVVPGLSLNPDDVGDLHLDAPEPREVAVADVKDPHRVRVAEHAAGIKPGIRPGEGGPGRLSWRGIMGRDRDDTSWSTMTTYVPRLGEPG